MATKRRKKPVLGRPALPEGVARTAIITCKVSPDELALVDRLAAVYKIGRSDLLRRALHVLAANPDLLLRAPRPSTVVSDDDFNLVYGDVLRKDPTK